MRDDRRGFSRGTKINSPRQLQRLIAGLKQRGKRVVFTNGCFDLLHYGHVKYLREAKNLGDILVVAVNSDSSVKKIKGKNRPIVNASDRAKIIAALESVDYVVVFGEKTPLRLIKLLKPDILVKGADWHKDNIVGAAAVSGYGGRVSTIKLAKNRSTTKLITKIISLTRPGLANSLASCKTRS